MAGYVKLEVGYCEFICAVSAIFLLSVSVYALVGRRLLPLLQSLASGITFEVKRRSLTLFLVLSKQEVVFSGQTVAVITIVLKSTEVGYCEFVYMVSAVFLLPVWA